MHQFDAAAVFKGQKVRRKAGARIVIQLAAFCMEVCLIELFLRFEITAVKRDVIDFYNVPLLCFSLLFVLIHCNKMKIFEEKITFNRFK